MTQSDWDPYYNPEPYVPASLSEIYDLLAPMILGAPQFVDKTGYFPDQTIHTRFYQLTEGLAKVRKKLGEERYAAAIEFATQAKALFADDPQEDNGKTKQGRDALFGIEDIIQSVRTRRTAKRQVDDDGEVTGD